MTETLSKEDIQRMVSEFIRAYCAEKAKTSVVEANQFADDYLTEMSRDLTDEQANTFQELATPAMMELMKEDLAVEGEE